MSRRLRLSPDLSLPPDAVTQTFGILGKRGSGKTNAGRVMAEEFFASDLPFVVVDPVGAWWGLRSSRDGKGPGLSVPIFGGDHGDVPLERESGPLLADLVAEQRLSCVLDMVQFSEGDKARFLTDFAERLFQRNRDPLHLFLEEADDFIPQRVMGEKARLVGAWQRIVKRGRTRGLGATMIAQRSAAINKDVLTQCETLLVFRTTAPQDMKAIEGWLAFHGQKLDVLASLPSLKDGEAWVWSPSWLGKLEKIRLRLSQTFDSGATPKDVKGRRAPATLADVDLAAIEAQMKSTIERAKETDPKELRRRVVQLQGELARLRNERPAPTVERVEVPVIDDITVKRLEAALLEAEGFTDSLRRVAGSVVEAAAQTQRALDAARAVRPFTPSVRPQSLPAPKSQPRKPSAAEHRPAGSEAVLSKQAREMLEELARRYPVRLTPVQLAILSGYSTRSSQFRPAVRGLLDSGLVIQEGRELVITDAGLADAGVVGEAPMGPQETLNLWLGKLPPQPAAMLRAIWAAGSRGLIREDLSERTGYSMTSSQFAPSINLLVRNGLAEVDEDRIRLGDMLLEGAARR